MLYPAIIACMALACIEIRDPSSPEGVKSEQECRESLDKMRHAMPELLEQIWGVPVNPAKLQLHGLCRPERPAEPETTDGRNA